MTTPANDPVTISINGSNNDSNLILSSVSGSIIESGATHSHDVDTVPHLTTADVNELIAANESSKEEAANAAAAAAAASAAADLAEKQSYLPVLDNSRCLVNHGVGLDVKHLALSGNARTIIYNKYGDLLTVNYGDGVPFNNLDDNTVSIYRFGDYKSSEFKQLKSGHKNILLSKEDFRGFDPVKSHVGRRANNAPINGIAIRHYAENEISNGHPAVTKLFVAQPYGLFCWDYDDSTRYNAFNSKLTNGRLLANKLSCGIDSGFNYGTETRMSAYGLEYDGHNAREVLFNSSGDLHIGVGSLGNYDIIWSGDNSGQLTDERTVVKYIPSDTLKQHLANPDAEPLDWTDNITIPLLARGLRNACGLALDASDVVWCVNQGGDTHDPSGISGPYSEPFWNSNPACTLYRLARENSNKRYGFPFGFITGTDISVNGANVSPNKLVRLPNKTVSTRDALGRLQIAFVNPLTQTELNDDASFVQQANAIFPAHSTPIQLVFNQIDSNGNLTYDGKSDQRLVKNRGSTLINDFILITLKGAWGKLSGGWSPNSDVGGEGAGHKLVTYDLLNGEVKDFYNDPSGSFSSGFDKYAGLDLNGNLSYPPLGFVGPCFRPLGVNFDQLGNVMITQNYDYSTADMRPTQGETIMTLYKP